MWRTTPGLSQIRSVMERTLAIGTTGFPGLFGKIAVDTVKNGKKTDATKKFW
jgi:hypothetical protein